jgi:hypothetical protein
MSACVNARRVCVRMLPTAPLLSPSAVMEISSGASTTATMSYSPSVQNTSARTRALFAGSKEDGGYKINSVSYAASASGFTSRLASFVSRRSACFSSSRLSCNIC